MNDKKPYLIAYNDSIGGLEKDVSDFINVGYKPAGGIGVTYEGDSSIGEPYRRYYQAMIKNEQEYGLWNVRDGVWVTEMGGHIASASKPRMIAKAIELTRENECPYEARPLPTK